MQLGLSEEREEEEEGSLRPGGEDIQNIIIRLLDKFIKL